MDTTTQAEATTRLGASRGPTGATAAGSVSTTRGIARAAADQALGPVGFRRDCPVADDRPPRAP